mmetsp:Transcript_22695/g.31608  ORF Transcript_22695/g.31608 Transcript_22695/m.31608 type:complete len:210 (+) Transcript_22695:1299-1928(+)
MSNENRFGNRSFKHFSREHLHKCSKPRLISEFEMVRVSNIGKKRIKCQSSSLNPIASKVVTYSCGLFHRTPRPHNSTRFNFSYLLFGFPSFFSSSSGGPKCSLISCCKQAECSSGAHTSGSCLRKFFTFSGRSGLISVRLYSKCLSNTCFFGGLGEWSIRGLKAEMSSATQNLLSKIPCVKTNTNISALFANISKSCNSNRASLSRNTL